MPFGYDLDPEGCLIISERPVDSLSMTEAEVAQDIFRRIANGSTTIAECRRLNAFNVPTTRRYSGGTETTVSPRWYPSRLSAMLKNQVYTGTHTYQSRNGTIDRDVPALVERATWNQVQERLVKNRRMPQQAIHNYLLRGLIVCESCGLRYVGQPKKKAHGIAYYYRCGSQAAKVVPGERCKAKLVQANRIEEFVWQGCKDIILNPGKALAKAQRQLEARLQRSTTIDAERERSRKQIAGKTTERERVMVLFRRRRITLEEAEAQLDAIQYEINDLQATLAAIQAQEDITQTYAAQFNEAKRLLIALQSRLKDIEKLEDFTVKRQVIEMLVAEVRVKTYHPSTKRTAKITAAYHFSPDKSIDYTTELRCGKVDTSHKM